MLLERLGFMFFSSIESFSVFTLTMTLFRFQVRECLWQALFIMLLMNLQSFVLRNVISLDYLVPLISILIFTLLYTTVIKIPLVWSVICTILGYALFVIIQSIILVLLFDSIEEATKTLMNGYILQTVSAVVVLFLSWFMYKFGLGFSFDFEKLRFKFEDILVICLIVLFLILISIIFYGNQVGVNIVFFIVVLLIFLYYAIKKENLIDD